MTRAQRQRMRPLGWLLGCVAAGCCGLPGGSGAWAQDPQAQATWAGHQGRVNGLAFAPDGKTLVSSSADGSITLWNVAADRGKERAALRGRGTPAHGVAFDAAGKILAAAVGKDEQPNEVILWDVATAQKRLTLPAGTGEVAEVALTRDGTRVAVASDDTTVKLWDTATGKPLVDLKGHVGEVCAALFTPDDTILASGSWDSTARLWDTATGKERATLEHRSAIWSVALAPNGKTLAVGCGDGSLYFWDMPQGTERAVIKAHTARVWSLSFAPDGRTLASASPPDAIKLWDVATREERGTIKAQRTTAVSFTPDGKTLAAGDRQGTITLWDTSRHAGTR